MTNQPEDVPALLAWVQERSPHDALVDGAVELRARLGIRVGVLDLLSIGALGPVPAPRAEPITRALQAGHEAVALVSGIVDATRRWHSEDDPYRLLSVVLRLEGHGSQSLVRTLAAISLGHQR